MEGGEGGGGGSGGVDDGASAVGSEWRERARALKALAFRVWAMESATAASASTAVPATEGAGGLLAFVAPLLVPRTEPHLLHLLWANRFSELEQEQRDKYKDKDRDDYDAAVEEAGRLLDFAVGWVAAFPEDFKSDHPVIERMAAHARQWQEAMRERGDVKQGARAGRLVLRLEAAKVPSMTYAGGGDRMQSLLMRAGSHLRNVAAVQASTGRRRSLRVLIGQQAVHSSTVSLQQSASANPVQASRLAQQQPQILPDLSQSGPLTPRPSEYRMDFMAFDAGAIARELTLIEFGLFYNIRPRELLDQAWQREDKEKKAPNVSLLIARFNEVAFWIATEILQTQGSKMQTVVIKKLVDVASQCYDVGNFNTLMEIISGLSHSSVTRLKTAWKGLGDRHQRRFEELEQLMSPRNNFNDYRELLKKRTLEQSEKERERRDKKTSKMVSVPPILPYFALMLRDLTFINENPKYLPRCDRSSSESDDAHESFDDKTAESRTADSAGDDTDDGDGDSDSDSDDASQESGSSRRKRKTSKYGEEEANESDDDNGELDVNWDLMVMLNQVRQVIQQYQRINYAYVPNHELRRILTNLRFIADENELWRLSQISFSATSEKKRHRRSLSAPLKMKLEALLQQHDDRHKSKAAAAAAAAREKEDTRFRRLRKDYMSDEDGHESLDSLISIGVDGAEEEWERDSSSTTTTSPPMSPPWRSSATGNGNDEEEETPSRRRRKAAAAAAAQQQAAATASGTKEEAPKRRWEGGKKKAESMWDQFLHRYFSSHIPSNRENTDSWRFYQSLTSGLDDQLRESNEALRSKINGRTTQPSKLSRGGSDQSKFKRVADDAKQRKKSGAAGGETNSGGSGKRGGSGDFFQHLSGGAKEMLEKEKTTTGADSDKASEAVTKPKSKRQTLRERASTTTDVVSTPPPFADSTPPSPMGPTPAMPRSHSSGDQRREGSFVFFENLSGGAQAMLQRDVLPPSPSTPRRDSPPTSPRSSSTSASSSSSPSLSSSSSSPRGPKSPRSCASGAAESLGSSSLPVRKGRARRTSLATATSEFLVVQRSLEGSAD